MIQLGVLLAVFAYFLYVLLDRDYYCGSGRIKPGGVAVGIAAGLYATLYLITRIAFAGGMPT